MKHTLIGTIGLLIVMTTGLPIAHAEMAPIDSILLRQHVAALSDDSMQGRRAGTTGERKAAKYLSLAFERLQIPAAGDNKSYFQTFSLRRAAIYSSSFVQIGNDTLRYPGDFSVFRVPDKETTWTAGLIFAGFGIHRPDRGIDSYEFLDVENRLVVVVAPEHWCKDVVPKEVQASAKELAAWAQELGAAGILLLSKSSGIGPRWNGERRLAAELFDPIDTTGFLWIEIDDGEEFFKSHFPLSPMSTPIPTTQSVSEVLVSSVMDVIPLVASNVISILEGTDLRHEHVVITAHFDHLGMKRTLHEDSIYNGALDNASGVASMLEIARSIRLSGIEPRRSIIFLATSGEEVGLLGARYYIEHPTVKGEIVANVNIDVLGLAPIGGQCFITLLGGEYTDMGETFARAAQQVGIQVAPNKLPSYFYKTDSYAFASVGIPSISPASGLNRRDAMDGLDQFKKYYHQPCDELGKAPLNFLILQQQTEAIARGVLELANKDHKPQWTRSLDSQWWLKVRDMLGFASMWIHKRLF